MMKIFELTNNKGDQVRILNYGARIQSWKLQLNNEVRYVVLGFDNLDDYLTDNAYLGAIVAPYANRIGNASCNIDNQLIEFTANENNNLLHSGCNAASNQYWNLVEHNQKKLVLSLHMEDGFNGFPGSIHFQVSYEFNDQGKLSIKLNAKSEKTTIIGPTSHPYFNLNGTNHNTDGHLLQIESQQITQIDEQNIPTGELLNIKGSKFDFSEFTPLYNDKKIDHNYVVKPEITNAQASVISCDGKVMMQVFSNFPGMQFYTADYLSEPFSSRQGFCLEPQFYPNSPNIKHFPFTPTRAGELFEKTIIYQITAI